MSYFIGSDARNGLGTRRLLPRGNASQGTIRNTAHVTVNVGLVIVKREFVVTVVQREHIHAWMKLGRIKVVYWACFAFKTVETKTSGLFLWARLPNIGLPYRLGWTRVAFDSGARPDRTVGLHRCFRLGFDHRQHGFARQLVCAEFVPDILFAFRVFLRPDCPKLISKSLVIVACRVFSLHNSWLKWRRLTVNILVISIRKLRRR